MSKLYYTERGHAIPTLGEEFTTFRRARKVLGLPSTQHPASLYVLAQSYDDSDASLRVAVNGRETAPIEAKPGSGYKWYTATVQPELFVTGDNVFDLWCDATAMNGWSLAVEAGHASPGSQVSDDSGRTWRDHGMSYLNVVRGEYVVRVRLAEGEDPAPPAMVWEDLEHPRVESLRRAMPPKALGTAPPIDRVRILTAWLASAWEHTNSSIGTQFAPWDAETILDWGGKRRGQYNARPVAMCVHYGAAFVSACQAMGVPARCAVFTEHPDGSGHFTAEFWSEEHEKWAMVDPNLDIVFQQEGVPMSVTEIQAAAPCLGDLADTGPGFEAQRQNSRIIDFLDDGYFEGRYFRHRAIWYRSDLLAHPEYSPPAHGTMHYCEVGLVWEQRDKELFPMFPYFGDTGYFDGPPQ